MLHKAVAASWGCSCAKTHVSNIQLNWHGSPKPIAERFSLALPDLHNTGGHETDGSTRWTTMAVHIQRTQTEADSPVASLSGNVIEPLAKKKGIRWLEFFSAGDKVAAVIAPGE
jgi:hypothetical protein